MPDEQPLGTQAAHTFHTAACKGLGVSPGERGSRARVHEYIGEHQSVYSRALSQNRVSLDTVAKWVAKYNQKQEEAGLLLRLVTDGEQVSITKHRSPLQ